MKYRLLVCLICLVPIVSAVGQDQAITLDHVTGLFNTNSVVADPDTLVVFYIRFTNNESNYFKGIINGFRVYSPDGAEWTTTETDTLPVLAWKVRFDLIFYNNNFSITGSGADTVAWGGTGLGIGDGQGIPANFDDVVYTITIGPIDVVHHAKMICLDSAFYPPSGTWKWAGGTGIGDRWPTWDGPHCFGVRDLSVDVKATASDNLPTTYALSQNYPNPFNPTTEIAFDLPTRTHVTLTVYNVLGQQVTTLVNEKMSAGKYVADWNGRSSGGNEVASGIYFYRIHTEQFTQTKKMVLLK